MAMASERILAESVDAAEFPHLAQRYRIFGVPKIVINETTQFEGAVPERAFLDYVLEAAGGKAPA